MGLKQKVVNSYGITYWEKNKAAILSNADRYGSLNQWRAAYNADLRRRVLRHPNDYPPEVRRKLLGSVLDGKARVD